MCMKYEKEGYQCFDHFFILEGDFLELMQGYGAEITDSDKARDELFALLESWHERGIIVPVSRKEQGV